MRVSAIVFIFMLHIIQPLILKAQVEPIMNFPFNGNSVDETSNGNNAVNFGATLTTDRFGNENSAYYFDGIDDFMEISPVSDLTAVGDFTISMWIEFKSWTYPNVPTESISALEEAKYIFNGHTWSSTASNDFYREGINIIASRDTNDNEFINTGIVYTYSPITYYRTVNEVYNFTEWKHVVYLRKDGVFTTFINGEIASISFANGSVNLGKNLNMMHNLFLGTFCGNNSNIAYNGTYNYKGKIDDLKFFTSSLTLQEVLKLYYENTFSPIVIDGIVENVSRKGREDGAITISVTGGIGPYVYKWSNDSVSQNISDLIPGTYTITVTDIIGNEAIKNFLVEQNYPPDSLSIYGNVYGDNIPIENVNIMLFASNNNILTFVSQTVSGSNGEFVFEQLLPDFYTILVIPDESMEYAPTYFCNALQKKRATYIPLQGRASHVIISLLPKYPLQGESTIQGKVQYNSTDYSQQIVYLLKNDSIINSCFLKSDSSFQFNNIPKGTYTLLLEQTDNSTKEVTIYVENSIETYSFDITEILDYHYKNDNLFALIHESLFLKKCSKYKIYNLNGIELQSGENSVVSLQKLKTGFYVIYLYSDSFLTNRFLFFKK